MRLALLGGASLAVLAASPALAKPIPKQPSNAAILERLNALEAKVDALQAENTTLHQQLEAQQATVATIPAQVSTAVAEKTPLAPPAPKPQTQVTWGPAPQFTSPDGNFTFKPRGILDVDYVGFNERKGGYPYDNGTQIRRGRFGFDGTFAKQFAYRVEAEYVGGTVSLLDAYVAYTGTKNFTLTLGQLKIPAGLEANSSDSFNEFLERGMANTAFGAVGGERRVGVTFAYANPVLTATAGVYGANEATARDALTHDEPWSVNGRVTVEPINKPGRLVHVGASAYHVSHLPSDGVSIGDRPNVRVDNGLLEQVKVGGADSTGKALAAGGVDTATFYGLEGAGILGPFSVQGEYSHMHLNRVGTAPSLNFDGYYVFGSFFVTGESRSFRGGTIDRLKPIRPFDPSRGNWGAIEIAARYDKLNLTDHNFSALNHDAHAWTAALNWYLTGNVKLMFNYVRFEGQNSPLVVAPVSINGTTAKGDAFATRLHLDF
jgi:phosphate-selective porin OprO and OprP